MTEERFRGFQNLDLHRAVSEAVAFFGEGLHVNRDALGPKGGCHPFGLLRNDDLVLQALEKDHGASNPIGMLQW